MERSIEEYQDDVIQNIIRVILGDEVHGVARTSELEHRQAWVIKLLMEEYPDIPADWVLELIEETWEGKEKPVELMGEIALCGASQEWYGKIITLLDGRRDKNSENFTTLRRRLLATFT